MAMEVEAEFCGALQFIRCEDLGAMLQGIGRDGEGGCPDVDLAAGPPQAGRGNGPLKIIRQTRQG